MNAVIIFELGNTKCETVEEMSTWVKKVVEGTLLENSKVFLHVIPQVLQ